MANQQLIDYVKGQMVAGTAEADIRKILKDAGWPDAEVEEGIKGAKPAASASPVAAAPIVVAAQPMKAAEPAIAEIRSEPKKEPKSFDFMSSPAGLSTFSATASVKEKEVKPAGEILTDSVSATPGRASMLPWIVAGVAVVAMIGVSIYFFIGNGSLNEQVVSLTSANNALSEKVNLSQNSGDSTATELTNLKKDLSDANALLGLFVVPVLTGSSTLQATEVSLSGGLALVKAQYALTTKEGVIFFVKNYKDAKVDSALKPLLGTQITVSGPHIPGTFEITVSGLNGGSLPELAPAAPAASTPAATSSKTKVPAQATTTQGL